MSDIQQILLLILGVARFMIFVHIIVSLLISFNVLNPHQPFVRAIWQGLEKLFEPIYTPIRKALPDTQVFSDHDGQFQFKPVKPEATDEKPADQAAAKPVNDKCPVSGAPVKPGFVSTFEGKTVGFCCNNCKGKFDAEPAKFAGKLPQ